MRVPVVDNQKIEKYFNSFFRKDVRLSAEAGFIRNLASSLG